MFEIIPLNEMKNFIYLKNDDLSSKICQFSQTVKNYSLIKTGEILGNFYDFETKKNIIEIKSEYSGYIRYLIKENEELERISSNDNLKIAEIIKCSHSQKTKGKCEICDEEIINCSSEVYYLNIKNSFRINKWQIKPGKFIKKSVLLAFYSEIEKKIINDDNKEEINKEINEEIIEEEKFLEKKLFSVNSGFIYNLIEENKVLTNKMPIFYMKKCSHNIVFNSLCAECGEVVELSKKNVFAIAQQSKNLTFGDEKSQEIDKEFTENLIKEKKLLLILDLDNTLIHAIFDGLNRKFKLNHHKDVYELACNFNNYSEKFILKIRPFFEFFFTEIKESYNFYIYTMGSRSYAENVCNLMNNILEKIGIFIKRDQIISKDDNFSSSYKSLKRIIPFNEFMVLVLDDRPEVWSYSPNLIFTKPYYFFDEKSFKQGINSIDKNEFNSINNEEKNEIKIHRKNDNFLFFVTFVLKKIHKVFYLLKNKGFEPNVSEIYSKIKSTILIDKKIIFSGIIDKTTNIEENLYFKIAKKMGANVVENFDEGEIFCIITDKFKPTKKIKEAKKNKIPIVHFIWLEFCQLYATLLSFDQFDLNKIKNFEVDNKDFIDEIELNLSQNNKILVEKDLENNSDKLFKMFFNGKKIK